MYKSIRYGSLFLVCILLFFVCSCKTADKSESNYLDDEIISVERKIVDKNNMEDSSAIMSGDISKNKSVNAKSNAGGSETTVSNNDSTKKDTVYKYEYAFFDKRYYANSVLSSGNSARLKNAFNKAKSGKKITVAFIGGSITEGTGADKNNCYSALVANWFRKTFKSADINYVNAGIGTAGSLFGVHRVDNDVISHNPDVVFVDFAVNDKGKNTELENATFDALIQKLYNSSSKPAVISVAMATKSGWNSEKNENLICREYEIPMLSFSKYIHTTINSGKYLWSDVFVDDVHPNRVGHIIISEFVIYHMEKVLGEIDKEDSSAADTVKEPYTVESARFTTAKRLNPVSIVTLSNSGFSAVNSEFQYTSGYWETATQNAEISFSVKTKTLTLFYAKLPSDGGRFQLYIDGNLIKEYACATSDTWEYINSVVVASYDTVESHTIMIKSISENGKRVLISGIGVTS